MILLILPTDTSLEVSSFTGARQKTFQPAFSDKRQSKKIAYLTFDDGSSVNTEDILEILAQNHIQATFFVMGHTEDYAMKGYQQILEGAMKLPSILFLMIIKIFISQMIISLRIFIN